MSVDDVIADIEAQRPDDPSVEAELGKPPARAGEGQKLCLECGLEPSVNGGRCWLCRGRSMVDEAR
jgi:hypothetical protein